MGEIELGGFYVPPPPGSFPPSNPGVLCFPPGGNDARNIKYPLPGGETKATSVFLCVICGAD